MNDPRETTVNATARNLIRRLTAAIRTAVQVSRAARYMALNGPLQEQLNSGLLIQGSTYLRTLGLNDGGVSSFRSHYGKKVKAAYRDNNNGRTPLMAWVQIDGRWMHVCVYHPADPALRTGVAAYPRLADTVRSAFAEAA
jgi:hypothetical protein